MSLLLKALEGAEQDRKKRENARQHPPSSSETLEFDANTPSVSQKPTGWDARSRGAMGREENRESYLEFMGREQEVVDPEVAVASPPADNPKNRMASDNDEAVFESERDGVSDRGSPGMARRIREASVQGVGKSRKWVIAGGGALALLCVLAYGGMVYWQAVMPQPFPGPPPLMAKQGALVETPHPPSPQPEPKGDTSPKPPATEPPATQIPREPMVAVKPPQEESPPVIQERKREERIRRRLAEAVAQEREETSADQTEVAEVTEVAAEAMANNTLIKNRVFTLKLSKMREAFAEGRTQEAQRGFMAALEQEGENKDALFGMAAVMVRQGRIREAEGYYLKLLALDPSDSVALAGLSGIRTDMDPLRRESVIKAILQREPDAHHLHFALGGLYAAQKRWGEAQQAFFRAMSGKSDNPDYVFNLAVSLDHLGQGGQALAFYRKAVVLAAMHSAGFSVAQAEKRISALEMKPEAFPVAVARERMNPL
ncbi:MAG: tetratricopeptide repeat protein [Magnetococcales bacterium]|nr:tetratricopeptide repeat protein [Magnetococcales bacterium]